MIKNNRLVIKLVFPKINLSLFLLMLFCVSTAVQASHLEKEAFGKSEKGFVKVDKDTRIFYEKIGNGEQVVVIPLHLYMFEEFKHLAKSRTLIIYDVRNRGASDREEDTGKLTIQQDVEDLEKLREHFALKKMSLIGESYTGLMIVMYAMKYPQYVEKLVQIGAVPLKFGTEYPKELTANDKSPVPDPAEVAKLNELKKQDYHKKNPKDYCEKEWIVFRKMMVGQPELAVKLKSPCKYPNEWSDSLDRHLTHHFGSVQKVDIPKEEAAKVEVPVLTIHGTKDRNAPYGAGKEWSELLPNSTLLTVKGAAHFPWIDEPKLVLTAIENFLSGKPIIFEFASGLYECLFIEQNNHHISSRYDDYDEDFYPVKTDEKAQNNISEIDKFLQKLESEGFAGVFLVSKDGKTLLRKGYGFSDQANKVFNTAETGFDIGSITKVFTAAAIYKLEMQGKLSLNDGLSKFFKDIPSDKARITLEQLVKHTAGFADIIDENAKEIEYAVEFDYKAVSRKEIIRRAFQSKLKFSRGEKREYSNLGYSLLGVIIEIAAGISYEEYIYAEIFEPAGMNKTGYLKPKWKKSNLAIGYKEEKAWGTPLDHKWLADGPSWNLRANGGMISNVDDLHLWIKALEGEKLLSNKAKKAYFDAMGVRPNSQGVQMMGPAGSNGIFNAVYLWYLEEDRILIGLSNVDKFGVENYIGKIPGKMRRLGL